MRDLVSIGEGTADRRLPWHKLSIQNLTAFEFLSTGEAQLHVLLPDLKHSHPVQKPVEVFQVFLGC